MSVRPGKLIDVLGHEITSAVRVCTFLNFSFLPVSLSIATSTVTIVFFRRATSPSLPSSPLTEALQLCSGHPHPPTTIRGFLRVAGELVCLPELFLFSFSLYRATGVDLHRRPQVLIAGSLRCCFGLDGASVWFTAASRIFFNRNARPAPSARASSALLTGVHSQDYVFLCNINVKSKPPAFFG
jgi:hypothetical protein